MADRSDFEEQRALLLKDVVASIENVLQNINRLNRNLEGIIAVGFVDHASCTVIDGQTGRQ